MSTLENIELQKFLSSIQQEVSAIFKTEEEGTTPEEVFTDIALSMLSDSGETENYRICYDEKVSKRGVEHKINAYALSENYETLDLFITIFNESDKVQLVPKTDADKAIERLLKFFRNAVYKDYAATVEPSSEIFDLAHTIANAPEIKEFLTRVNIYLLTDGEIKAEFKSTEKIAGYSIFYRIIDINYLFNLSEKSRIPIEIDFDSNGIALPCIVANNFNEVYQSYLAIIPGEILGSIYEQFGSRLLEQNVRSFLQFTGKINKGIRKTIQEEPHMFLAFNNGIAATAEEVRLVDLPDGMGKAIGFVKDFQIVNGGQTTASIYHTWKKDKANISQIFVPIKLSVLKRKDKFSEIVGRISEYANTQNKVSVSDLSSNRPFHIKLENLSRSIVSPHISGNPNQTKWFYERARGQYKNARIKDGFTKSRQKAFDLMNPRNQLFTKEELAKYQNTYEEIVEGRKLVIGPHIVVRGGQKNYVQFINYNEVKNPDNIYFEDTIAKAILFRSAEKIYGVKPNAIGDMRYLTVPYSIAYLGYKTNYKLDLYRIWKNQAISEQLSKLLYELMGKVEKFIKSNAPGSLYGEWAKKEECWNVLKTSLINVDQEIIQDDFINAKRLNQRKRIAENDSEDQQIQEDIEKIKSIPYKIWDKIEQWGLVTNKLTQQQRNTALTISGRVRNNSKISDYERITGIKIIDIAIEYAPELLFEIDEISTKIEYVVNENEIEITLELINKMVDWDRKNKRLKDQYFVYLNNIVQGKYPLNEKAENYAKISFRFLEKFGFKP